MFVAKGFQSSRSHSKRLVSQYVVDLWSVCWCGSRHAVWGWLFVFLVLLLNTIVFHLLYFPRRNAAQHLHTWNYCALLVEIWRWLVLHVKSTRVLHPSFPPRIWMNIQVMILFKHQYCAGCISKWVKAYFESGDEQSACQVTNSAIAVFVPPSTQSLY